MKRRATARLAGLGVTALLAACSTTERQLTAAPPPTPLAKPPPAEIWQPPEIDEAAALKRLMANSPKPIPTRPLNVKTQCTFSDPTGYRGSLRLQVTDAAVEKFEAEVMIPKRGVCRFALKDFAQAEHLPNVRLAADACSVHMWEQGARTTVAFTGCAAQCSGEAFDYLWPILVDTNGGRCS